MNEILKYDFLKKIQDLDFVERIYIYGSRARGDNQERSDIDMAVECPKADWKDWLLVTDIIDGADTLLKIDCVRLDELSNNNKLKENIIREGKIIYERKFQA